MLPSTFLAWFALYRYPAFYVGAILEGPILMTLSGVFLRLGYVQFWPVYIALILGDLTGDLAWYGIGHWYARPFLARFGKFFSITEAALQSTERFYRRHHSNILFFSKLTMGFGFALPILMTAGMIRVPLRKFIALNVLGQMVFTGLLLSLGYYFGNAIVAINEGFRVFSIIAFIAFIYLLFHGIGLFLRRRFFPHS